MSAATYSPTLLSAMLRATADNLDATPIAVIVEDAMQTAHDRGHTGALALTAVTWALRDAAKIVDTLA